MAQRAIPLVADKDPVEVIYEDADIIAVNKPAGVISAPKHRFTVSKSSTQQSSILFLLFPQLAKWPVCIRGFCKVVACSVPRHSTDYHLESCVLHGC